MKSIKVMILPNIQVAMSGVWRIERERELVRLTYSDGSTETASVPLAKWAEIRELPFSIISEVQSRRN